MKYLVALDGSPSSENALDWVITSMNKMNDEIYLVSGTQDLLGNYGTWTAAEFSVLAENTQLQLEKETVALLQKYGKKCHRDGVKNVFGLRGTGHIGELICKAAKSKSIDLLVIGRRGMSKIKRAFVGSTSRYVVEHAPCNVVVVKEDVAALQKKEQVEEEKRSKEERTAAHIGAVIDEEEERKRRMKEDGLIEERHFHVENFSDVFKSMEEHD